MILACLLAGGCQRSARVALPPGQVVDLSKGWVDVTEGMDQEILLTNPEAPGGTRRMALNVRVRGYRRTDPQPLEFTTVGAGSLPTAAVSEGGK
jgi:hypothetical protein